MKRIGVVTSTRAEYGLLKNVMFRIKNDDDLSLVLFVTGTHFLYEYGHTIDEIIEDGFKVDESIDILMKSDDSSAISKSMGMASILFGDAFKRHILDMIVILGDRYELLPICQAAMCARIPIAHISGGEATEGLIDEAIRHCITKMSYIHFPSCESYKKRIIQLGEHPDRVFDFGDVGVENVLNTKLLEKNELDIELGINLKKPYFSVTFHPVTLEDNTAEQQIKELLDALDSLPQFQFVFTKSNADTGNQIINNRIDNFALIHDNCFSFESLGVIKYLSLLKYSSGIIGNSSSGIVEAPIFGVPTINIGDRQKGRLKADSIIDCEPRKEDILNAINYSRDPIFLRDKCNGNSAYWSNNTSENIVKTIKKFLNNDEIDLKKKFYDVDFNYKD